MKRKFLIVLLSIICVVCLALGISACTLSSGTDSTDGADSTTVMEEGVVYFTDFSIKYTSAEDSPNGDINESTLTDEIDGSVQSYYLVMNFDMQLANNTDGLEYITVKFIVLDANVVETIINYADTSNVSAITSDGQTTITATYSLPDKAKSVKNIHLVLELKPKTTGGTDIYYTFSSDTKQIGSYTDKDITYKYTNSSISTSKTTLEYTLNDDGQSYSVTGIGTKSDPIIYIKNTYNSLPVTSISDSAFEYNTTLTSITISNSITTIGNSAFYSCTAVTDIIILDGVTFIGDYAFRECAKLTSITIPNSVTSIGKYAFCNCTTLTNITIPNSVTSIGEYAFCNCTSLTNVTIPDSVTSIGTRAFGNCTSLTNLTIPNSVTSIGSGAFSDCTSLTSITLPFVGGSTSNNTYFGYIFGASSYKNNSSYIPSSLKTVVITGSSSISESAFYYCTSLTSITISNSVTSIGKSAFFDCTSLTSITLPFVGGSTTENTYFGYIFGASDYGGHFTYVPSTLKTVVITGGSTISEYAFYGCTTIESITIPDSVTSIGNGAFQKCTFLKNVTIGNGVTFIGSLAFYNCTWLTSITIPNSVTSIGSFAFDECSSLTSVTFENTSGWYVTISSGTTSRTDISSSDLADTSTAATYLKNDYWNFYWYRSAN